MAHQGIISIVVVELQLRKVCQCVKRVEVWMCPILGPISTPPDHQGSLGLMHAPARTREIEVKPFFAMSRWNRKHVSNDLQDSARDLPCSPSFPRLNPTVRIKSRGLLSQVACAHAWAAAPPAGGSAATVLVGCWRRRAGMHLARPSASAEGLR